MRPPFRLAAVAACITLAGACAPAGRDAGDGTDTTLAGRAPAPADTIFQRGIATLRGDSLSFTGCGNTTSARLEDRTGGALTSAVRTLGGEGVYVEMNGNEAADAEAAVVALELLRAAPVGEGGGCDRPPGEYVYQAFGNEPFWSVRVDTDSLVFLQPEDPNRVAWPAPAVVPSLDAAGARTWTIEGPDGTPVLTLVLERATCADGMSGETTTFRARARYAGRDLEGCARAGTAADEVR